MDQQRPGGEGKRPGGEMNSPRTGETTKSQLLPLAANWTDLPKKPYFLPGIAVVISVMLLFAYMGDSTANYRVMYMGELPVDIPVYFIVLAALLTLGTGFAVYRMIGKRYAWWVMPAAALLTAIVIKSPLLGLVQQIAGFGTPEVANGDSWLIRFIKMFFLAGLPEELLKSIPVFLGVLIALKLKDRASPLAQLSVNEPLDGVLLGVAAGLGFAFVETLTQYVPEVMAGGLDSARAIYTVYIATAKLVGAAQAAVMIQKLMPGAASSLQLLIPRLLSGICGHAAYAGIFGYYIGLAFYKPANRVKTLLIGLAIAASCHAAWDSDLGNLGMTIVALLSFALLMACIAKGRELSPMRAQLQPSQIVDSLSRIYPTAAVAANTGPVVVAKAAAPAPTPAPRPAPAAAAPQNSMTWDDDSNLLTLEIGTARIPATAGARLYERQAPGAESINADNIVAEINANPSDPSMLGIKNLSTQVWQVTTDKGEQRDLVTGRSVRLTRGTQIRIGDLVAYVK
jgi:RsiW-degrading membrane proteinase PrsW (M82 family)